MLLRRIGERECISAISLPNLEESGNLQALFNSLSDRFQILEIWKTARQGHNRRCAGVRRPFVPARPSVGATPSKCKQVLKVKHHLQAIYAFVRCNCARDLVVVREAPARTRHRCGDARYTCTHVSWFTCAIGTSGSVTCV